MRMFLSFKMMLKEKIVIISLLLPIALALGAKIYLPYSVVETKIGVVNELVDVETINDLSRFADVELFDNVDLLKAKILDSSDELIGLVKEGGNYRILLQGNEKTITKKYAEILIKFINGRISLDDVIVLEYSDGKFNIATFLNVIILMIALFMGSVINAFNIVAEKENGVIKINDILPISSTKYLSVTFHK